jgi:hypothetical protein
MPSAGEPHLQMRRGVGVRDKNAVTRHDRRQGFDLAAA